MRSWEDGPTALARARCAVAAWRQQHPQGSTDQLLADFGGQFHPDDSMVLRAVLFALDRHQAREITGVTARAAR